jgi:hypothetical protein
MDVLHAERVGQGGLVEGGAHCNLDAAVGFCSGELYCVRYIELAMLLLRYLGEASYLVSSLPCLDRQKRQTRLTHQIYEHLQHPAGIKQGPLDTGEVSIVLFQSVLGVKRVE